FVYMVYYIDRHLFSNFVEYRFLKYDLMILWISSLSVVISPISDFINLETLSLPLGKVPWSAEKKQKDGSCFCIHSVYLCLFIGFLYLDGYFLIKVGKIFNDFVEYAFCAFELVFFSFSIPII
ncbi:hypothetical protein STEG23_020510, partial [Scotinomys teguina]